MADDQNNYLSEQLEQIISNVNFWYLQSSFSNLPLQ